MLIKTYTKNILRKYCLCPSKKLGQHFLIDKTIIKKVINAAELQPRDTVLEIGPGTGTLTKEIAKKVKTVIAIEKDLKMCEILKETMKEYKNVKIIQKDILMTKSRDRAILSYINYKVIGNLPFYLTAPVIRKFLESGKSRPGQPGQMILVVQKEVGQRICSQPPNMNILAVSVQFYAHAKIIAYIPKKCFWPQPKVDSAIIKIVPQQFHVQVSQQFCERFFRIVKSGFSQPRKQLINTLCSGLKIEREKIKNWLLKNNIQTIQRAETLTIKQWMLLAKNFNSILN